jgi:hypothetical protein
VKYRCLHDAKDGGDLICGDGRLKFAGVAGGKGEVKVGDGDGDGKEMERRWKGEVEVQVRETFHVGRRAL